MVTVKVAPGARSNSLSPAGRGRSEGTAMAVSKRIVRENARPLTAAGKKRNVCVVVSDLAAARSSWSPASYARSATGGRTIAFSSLPSIRLGVTGGPREAD